MVLSCTFTLVYVIRENKTKQEVLYRYLSGLGIPTIIPVKPEIICGDDQTRISSRDFTNLKYLLWCVSLPRLRHPTTLRESWVRTSCFTFYLTFPTFPTDSFGIDSQRRFYSRHLSPAYCRWSSPSRPSWGPEWSHQCPLERKWLCPALALLTCLSKWQMCVSTDWPGNAGEVHVLTASDKTATIASETWCHEAARGRVYAVLNHWLKTEIRKQELKVETDSEKPFKPVCVSWCGFHQTFCVSWIILLVSVPTVSQIFPFLANSR